MGRHCIVCLSSETKIEFCPQLPSSKLSQCLNCGAMLPATLVGRRPRRLQHEQQRSSSKTQNSKSQPLSLMAGPVVDCWWWQSCFCGIACVVCLSFVQQQFFWKLPAPPAFCTRLASSWGTVRVMWKLVSVHEVGFLLDACCRSLVCTFPSSL